MGQAQFMKKCIKCVAQRIPLHLQEQCTTLDRLNLALRSGMRTRAYMLGGKRLYITAAEANANITVPLFRTPPNKLRALGCQFRRVSLRRSGNRSYCTSGSSQTAVAMLNLSQIIFILCLARLYLSAVLRPEVPKILLSCLTRSWLHCYHPEGVPQWAPYGADIASAVP